MLLLWLRGQTLPGFNLEILSDILGVICDDFRRFQNKIKQSD